MAKILPGGGGPRLSQNRIKYTFSLVITIIGLLSLFVGTSYALLRGIDTSDNEQLIKTGSVKLKLTEKFENIDKKITVMSDVDGLVQETTYDFNLKNIGSEPAKFDIKLINEVPSSYVGEVLSLDYFRIGLEINGEEHGPMSLKDAKGIIDSDIIYKGEMINYTMRIWLDEEKSEELKNMEDYKAFLKLEIEAQQRVEEMDTLENVTTFSYTGDVQEYRIPRDGYYKIEAWGAQGGSYSDTYYGGYGAYTSGEIYLESGEKLYIYVGEQPVAASTSTNYTRGGYNGGGNSGYNAATDYSRGGGGATDIRLEKADENEKYRYVRNYLNGSSKNASSHWVEIQVYDISGTLISQGKPVTYNGTAEGTNQQVVTDGSTATTSYFGIGPGSNSYVEIDLGAEYEIGYVKMWHYYSDGRTYYDNKVMLFDENKTESVTLFDSDINGTYGETSSGTEVYNSKYIKSLRSRIMVAAGGGGSTYNSSYKLVGANGGGLTGYSGTSSYSATVPTGGTQTSYGKGYHTISARLAGFGYGGGPETAGTVTGWGGGGGSGYYGGALGYGFPGAGGSSYISGHTGCVAVTSKNDTTPKSGCTTGTTDNNCSIHYSDKKFINTKMIDGAGYSWSNTKNKLTEMPNATKEEGYYDLGKGNPKNGYARITYMNSKTDKEFTYTGDVQEYKVIRDGYYKIETWGAQGGGGYISTGTFYEGGYGAYTSGEIYLKTGEILYFYVGGKGIDGSTGDTNTKLFTGGYNGGGNGYSHSYSGGGATDVRLVSGNWDNITSLRSRIMVAAGGGGTSSHSTGGGYCVGGSAGGLNGYNGISGNAGQGGSGGTQTSGYAFGGGHTTTSISSSGGGGGYYGGIAGACTNTWDYCAGGGSSYISGHTGCVAVTSENDTTPKSGCTTGTTNNSCSVHYSNKKFINTVMIDGSGYSWSNTKGSYQQMPNHIGNGSYYQKGKGNDGNGYARIKLLDTDREYLYTNKSSEFTVVKTGNYEIEAWGAQGGSYSTSYIGGYGGYTKGEIHLEKGEKLYIYVGSQGEDLSSGTGGYNGGGNGVAAGSYKGYPGGGATDIRLVSGSWNDSKSLASRIMVAGAGGGAGYVTAPYYSSGGHAGGLTGYAGTSTYSSSNNLANAGGNQTRGGYNSYIAGLETAVAGGFGYGGSGTRGSTYGKSGGGSGYYGGSGGPEGLQPGGGGSSYISGHTGCVAVTSQDNPSPRSGCTTGTTDNSCSVHYSNKKFTNTVMIDGTGYSWTNIKNTLTKMPNYRGGFNEDSIGNKGNGFVSIKFID